MKYFLQWLVASSTLITAHAALGSDWSYSGKTGPAFWGNLQPEYQTCKVGHQQSPIEIEKSYQTRSLKPHFHYRAEAGEPLYIYFKKRKYYLHEIRFHVPSEHVFQDQSFDMEVHLIHQDKHGKYLMVGAFIIIGKENKRIQPFIDHLNQKKASDLADAVLFLPNHKDFFVYRGSLTVPPCTEGIPWFIHKKPIEISAAQANLLKVSQKLYGARPTQPLARRLVYSLTR